MVLGSALAVMSIVTPSVVSYATAVGWDRLPLTVLTLVVLLLEVAWWRLAGLIE